MVKLCKACGWRFKGGGAAWRRLRNRIKPRKTHQISEMQNMEAEKSSPRKLRRSPGKRNRENWYAYSSRHIYDPIGMMRLCVAFEISGRNHEAHLTSIINQLYEAEKASCSIGQQLKRRPIPNHKCCLEKELKPSHRERELLVGHRPAKPNARPRMCMSLLKKLTQGNHLVIASNLQIERERASERPQP